MVGAAEGMFLIIFLLVLVIGIAAMILWIWTIIDCATRESSEGNDKLVWILVIIFGNWIGALIYLLVRRPQRIRELGR